MEPAARSPVFRLPGGEPVRLRPLRPDDADHLQAYVRGLSGESRHNRFLGTLSELAPSQLDRLCAMDGRAGSAWLALAGEGPKAAMIAEAIQVTAPGSLRCEIALSVADPWQRRGLGTLLLRKMECRARKLGARCLFGDVLRTNVAMKGLARKAGFSIRSPFTDARLVEIVKDLSLPPSGVPCDDRFAPPPNTPAQMIAQ